MSDIIPEEIGLLDTVFPTAVTISFVNGVYVVHLWNYEAVEDNGAVQEMPIVSVGGEVVTLKDIITAEPSRIFIDRLAKQSYKPGSRLVIQLNAIETHGEVKIQMTSAVVLENNQAIQVIGRNYILKNSVQVQVNPETIVISIPDLTECPECGRAFTPKRSDQVYCSAKCGTRVRNRDYRRRKRLNR